MTREISTDPRDLRVQIAIAHPELDLRPPVLTECAAEGCGNTVIKGEQTHCPFHCDDWDW